MKILVTGGCGFIGSNFIRMILRDRPEWKVTNYDALTYAGNPDNLKSVEASENYRLVVGRIDDAGHISNLLNNSPYDVIVNFAAESHVDRSLLGAQVFARTNIEGTVSLLDAARRYKVGKFLQVSTDEVYGSLESDGFFTEETPLHPNNPYAASKASADLMVQAYVHTFDLNAVITRSSNNYGPYQYPEKFIPVCVSKAMEGKKLPVYGDGLQIRDWLHVEDNCRGILAALEKGRMGQVYNLGGGNEKPNILITKIILEAMSLPESSIEHVPDRLGHDRRYAVDFSKATMELGWKPRMHFELGMVNTVNWYLSNREWIASSKSRMEQSRVEQS